MNLSNLKTLSYDELRLLYKNFLNNQKLSKSAISTAYTDTFYLWRNGSKELFWNVADAEDFETEGKVALTKVLSENSTGNVNSLVSGYLSHLRRFRLFLSSDGANVPPEPKYKSREIIINKMYIGTYLSEGDNIGHEIINLYKADDGKNYIYLNSQGKIELSHGENKITVYWCVNLHQKYIKYWQRQRELLFLILLTAAFRRRRDIKDRLNLG